MVLRADEHRGAVGDADRHRDLGQLLAPSPTSVRWVLRVVAAAARVWNGVRSSGSVLTSSRPAGVKMLTSRAVVTGQDPRDPREASVAGLQRVLVDRGDRPALVAQRYDEVVEGIELQTPVQRREQRDRGDGERQRADAP